MASKKIRVNYYYPTIKIMDSNKKQRIILYKLEDVLKYLSSIDIKDRVYDIVKDEENIQLKIIRQNGKGIWELGFLKNTKDSIFKGKLDDELDKAESLDDDEFIGHECCMIYDPKTGVISLQNNVKSISYRNLGNFLNQFIHKIHRKANLELMPITMKPEYCNISDDERINYKNVILSYLDITGINEMANLENNKSVKKLAEISNDLGAIKGKLELSVGRTKSKFLGKLELKEIVTFFKKYPMLTNGLKVKMYDDDSIRTVDLIENKIGDEFTISVTKEDVKTFEKILSPMNSYLESKIDEELKNCVKITELEINK